MNPTPDPLSIVFEISPGPSLLGLSDMVYSYGSFGKRRKPNHHMPGFNRKKVERNRRQMRKVSQRANRK